MKKTTKNDFSKKLAKYGALSLAIAGVADASGQIIYTDVNPDYDSGPLGSYAVDFDGDGTEDLIVSQLSSGYNIVTADAGSSAGVLAASNGGYFYASNLAYGAVIDGGAGSFRSFGDLCAGVGYLGSQFCGTGDGYIGVEFEISGVTHYGWVRVDVSDSSNFVLKDFAYESTPNTSIIAGDVGTIGVNDEVFKGFNYFVANNQLTLTSNSAMEKITIYNLLGQETVSQKLSNSTEIVDLSSFGSGIYLAIVTIDGHNKTIKISKN